MTRWVAFVSVGVSASQRIPLSVLAQNPHKGFASKISHETRRGGGKARSQNRAVERTERTGQSREQKRAVSRREQELGPVDSEARLANMRGWVSVPGGFVRNVARIYAHDSSQMHRKLHKSVTNFSLLALGANPSLWLFVLLFFDLSIVYVVFCVFVKKCEILLARDERNH